MSNREEVGDLQLTLVDPNFLFCDKYITVRVPNLELGTRTVMKLKYKRAEGRVYNSLRLTCI